jgi:hypothetical protein
MWQAVLRRYRKVSIRQVLRNRLFELVFSERSNHEVYRAIKYRLAPLRIMVTVEEHDLLVATIIPEELFRMVWSNERISTSMHKQSRHQTSCTVVQWYNVVDVEISQGLHPVTDYIVDGIH